MGSVQVVVLADTHAPRRWRVCPPRVAEHLRTADLILHAGDVCTASVLAELAEYAPVTAVLGNNDGPDVAEWGAPRTAELELDGLKVSMVHDSGAAAGRLTRLRRRFPGGEGRLPGAAAIQKTVRSGTNIFGEPAAILVRTAVVTAAGAFDARFGFCLDLDLWCRLLQHGDLYMLDEALCGFRISNQSWSAALANRQQREFSEFVVDLGRRGVALSATDRTLARSRAWANALLRQAVTRVLLLSSRT